MTFIVEADRIRSPRSQFFRLDLLAGRATLAIAAALIGGLPMGYSSWLAFGCNVGAYFSGIASTSLYGWWWMAFALLGTSLGGRLRPLFQLGN